MLQRKIKSQVVQWETETLHWDQLLFHTWYRFCRPYRVEDVGELGES